MKLTAQSPSQRPTAEEILLDREVLCGSEPISPQVKTPLVPSILELQTTIAEQAKTIEIQKEEIEKLKRELAKALTLQNSNNLTCIHCTSMNIKHENSDYTEVSGNLDNLDVSEIHVCKNE